MQSITPDAFTDMTQPNIDWESRVRYSDVKTNQTTGAKSVNLSNLHPGGKATKLVLQVPQLMTWGVNDYEGKKFDMNMQFPDREALLTNTDVNTLLENLVALENKIKADAIVNSRAWFGRASVTKEIIDEKWNPMLRYKKDPNTGEDDLTKSPTWRVKFPYWERKEEDGVYDFHCDIFDMEGNCLYKPPPNGGKAGAPVNDIDISQFIQKRSEVVFSVVNGGIWFANGKFGTTWRIHQMAVEVVENMEGKCMLFLGNKAKAKAKASEPERNAAPSRAVTVSVEDTDDEEEEATHEKNAEEGAAAPEPASTTTTTPTPTDASADADEEATKSTNVSQPKRKKVVKK